MPRLVRLILVLPLALATCLAGVLNGNVLCIAGGHHVAVEPEHAPGECPDSSHDEQGDDAGHCTDVSAEFQLLRSGDRTAVDTAAVELPQFLVPSPSAALAMSQRGAAAAFVAASPPSPELDSLASIVLVN